MKHDLKIVSLHDAFLKCSCTWNLIYTGSLTKKEAIREHDKHIYSEFVAKWLKIHSISKPPSFTNWRSNYKTV